ncbi:MAG: DegT/DnrJ/EryC1/StrS family aminotransferase [Bacteroidales bacterium]|nr:DegT/DnrJ/EryC1/StrS family aminotransferase [Bacteroidales bacterium]MDD4385676.1 DegT/DnrJ/EryC1/StrS family aminotransferase [Bacteroidales bacterium]MDY0197565.1 DegT/DnrJ/EryC1/StrS family aminotransferase [Tenuifilaceae bacterium]
MSIPSNLQMVDLKGQYLRIKPEVDAAIQEVIDETAFIKGKQVAQFEVELAAYLGVKHVIGCANGTDALQLALMALELKPGDEVITPDFTFIATVEVVALLGLKPILVDVNLDDFTINIDALKKAITPKTKAIIPVHLFGQCANMEAIMEIANDKGIAVVEDLAQATGSTYYFSNGNSAKAGTIGTIGCTSFFPSKNLGCYGDGGALFTNDDRLAEEIRSIANHGMKIRYHHDTIGVNSRLDTIQAAILSVKLKHLDEYNVARQEAAMLYDSLFRDCKSLIIPQRVSWSDHIFHQYTLRLVNIDRKRLIEKLSEKGIPAMVYYPIPLHKQKALEPYVNEKMVKEYPNSIMLSESVLSLPMHTELTQEVQHYIADNVLSLL